MTSKNPKPNEFISQDVSDTLKANDTELSTLKTQLADAHDASSRLGQQLFEEKAKTQDLEQRLLRKEGALEEYKNDLERAHVKVGAFQRAFEQMRQQQAAENVG